MDLLTAHDIKFVFLIVTATITVMLLRLRGTVLNITAVNDTTMLLVVTPQPPSVQISKGKRLFVAFATQC